MIVLIKYHELIILVYNMIDDQEYRDHYVHTDRNIDMTILTDYFQNHDTCKNYSEKQKFTSLRDCSCGRVN